MPDRSEMFLESSSGFMLPFILDDDEEVEVSLGYGEQVHPSTREKFFHHGLDFVCSHRPLLAVATGAVVGAGQDAVHDSYVIIRYGKFEVKYGHLSQLFVRYGQKVEAGQQVAVWVAVPVVPACSAWARAKPRCMRRATTSVSPSRVVTSTLRT